eukprot:m.960390 g.960390  ORF g.960390 m.960390 type:complete len:154 (-) comp23886_c3_seq2:2347-2808(-)
MHSSCPSGSNGVILLLLPLCGPTPAPILSAVPSPRSSAAKQAIFSSTLNGDRWHVTVTHCCDQWWRHDVLQAMKLHRATGSGMSSAGQPQAGTAPGVVASASYDKYKKLYGTLLQHIVAQTSACSETASEADQKDTLAIVKSVAHLSAILEQM